MKTIYYLGSYRSELIKHRMPQGSSAEDNKMTYIINSLKSIGCDVVVLSVLASMKSGWNRKEVYRLDEHETHIYLSSFDTMRPVLCSIAALLRLVGIFFYLVSHLGKDDTLLVYHSQLFSVPVRLAKRLRGFELILEVEELFYKDNRNPKDVSRKKIELALINAADCYIVASNLLKTQVAGNKDCIVLYGAYHRPSTYNTAIDDGTIRIVYAGGIDTLRRVDVAVESAALLPDHYRLFILGNGEEGIIKGIQQQIQSVNARCGFNKVQYCGCLFYDELDAFLSGCHIGLNMQDIGASIECAAFPSKISTYFAHGLSVVSGKLKSIENSPFSEKVSYFEKVSPEVVAEAIIHAKIIDRDDCVSFIHVLEDCFWCQLSELMKITNSNEG